MRQRIKPAMSVFTLGMLPAAAQAQSIPGWLVAAVLSPVLVLFLCLILGVLARSVRMGALHAAIVLLWIVLFTLASYHVENDYVIWTPLVLYVLHAALLLVLIFLEIARKITSRAGTG